MAKIINDEHGRSSSQLERMLDQGSREPLDTRPFLLGFGDIWGTQGRTWTSTMKKGTWQGLRTNCSRRSQYVNSLQDHAVAPWLSVSSRSRNGVQSHSHLGIPLSTNQTGQPIYKYTFFGKRDQWKMCELIQQESLPSSRRTTQCQNGTKLAPNLL